jgi:hypothetical protein
VQLWGAKVHPHHLESRHVDFNYQVVADRLLCLRGLDSFFKASRIRREMAEEITSKTLGAHLRKRALTAGWIFTLAALAGAASLFLRIAPLGE